MNRWLATGVLCAVVTLHNAQRLAPVPLLTEFCQRLNVDYVGAGNLFGAFLFGTAVANIPVGILADRHGSKGLIAAGAALGLILSAIFALTQNYWIALAARFGLGAAGSLLFVPTLRYIVSSFPKETRGSAMGFMQVGSGMGMVFSLTILPLLSSRFDLTKTFLVLPALATFILVLVLFGLRAARPASKPVVWKQIGDLARCGPFWHLSAFHFLTMLSVYAVMGWLPTFLRLDFGYSATQAGVISALVNVAFAFFFAPRRACLRPSRRPHAYHGIRFAAFDGLLCGIYRQRPSGHDPDGGGINGTQHGFDHPVVPGPGWRNLQRYRFGIGCIGHQHGRPDWRLPSRYGRRLYPASKRNLRGRVGPSALVWWRTDSVSNCGARGTCNRSG